jgi:hypothetical protein
MKNVSAKASYVWRKFIEWYGAETVSKNFGQTPPADWCELIDSSIRDREVLDRVLAAVRTEHQRFPPRYPQFESIVQRIVDEDKKAQASASLHNAERLIEYVLASKPLTPAQICMTWQFIGRGNEIVGVVVPADTTVGAPGYRVMLEDMLVAVDFF